MGSVRSYKLRLRRKLAQFPESKYFAYLRDIPKPDLDSRILIEIPAYVDPETIPTMQSAIAKAANPDRIHFAVCYQGDDDAEANRIAGFPHTRVKRFAENRAPGLCAARYEAFKLWDGEEYVLHVDSHMRFASFWDVCIIDQYMQCPSEKKVLTEYAMNYADHVKLAPDADVFDANACVGGSFTCFSYYQSGAYKPRYRPRGRFEGPKPSLGAFIGGHFLFCEAHMDMEVPPDPDTYFTADEALVALRLWTHGYDIYHPGVRCAYHLYYRTDVTGAARFSSNSLQASKKNSETLRMEQLFGARDHGVDVGQFGLGTVRSADDYYRFCGADYRCRQAYMYSWWGRFGCNPAGHDLDLACVGDNVMAEKDHPMHGCDYTGAGAAKICVLVTACRCKSELAMTVDSLLDNAHNPDRVHVIVIAQDVDDQYLDPVAARGVEIVRCDAKGIGNALYTGEQHIPADADYVLYSEEHVYYVNGWDTAYVAYSKYCGDRAVLSDWARGLDPEKPPVLPFGNCMICANGISDFGHPHIRFGRGIDAHRPVRGAFTVAVFIFAPVGVVRDVPHSPDLCFYTNESYTTYRYWCAGIDVYHSPARYYAHLYDSSRQGGGTVAHDGPSVLDMDKVSRGKMKHLLGIPGGDASADARFALGTARSLKSFIAFSGVDPFTRKVDSRAAFGVFGDDCGAGQAVGKNTNCQTDGENWMKFVSSATPANLSAARNGCAICVADGATYIGSARDKVIMGHMASTGHVWASDEMSDYFDLAKTHYGVVPGSPGLFCDIGANIGTTSIHFKKSLDPGVKILALEPVEETYRMLSANMALNGIDDAILANLGVSGDGGSYGIAYNVTNPGASHLSLGGKGAATIRFDDFLRARDIRPADIKYVWVDTEGFEGAFLSGAMDTLSQIRVPVALQFTSQFLCNFGHAKLFIDAVSSLWSSYIVLGDKSRRVRPISELRLCFDVNYGLKRKRQNTLFMLPMLQQEGRPDCRKEDAAWVNSGPIKGEAVAAPLASRALVKPDIPALMAGCKGFTAAADMRDKWDALYGVRCGRASHIDMAAGAGLFVKEGCHFSIGDGCRIFMKSDARLIVLGDFSLYCNATIKVGTNACLVLGVGYANDNVRIDCQQYVHIGDALIGYDTYITDTDWHRLSDAGGSRLNPNASVVFDGHVWIGQGATILKGVHVGHGAVIGAKSLVCHDVPAGCAVAGNPAKIVRSGVSW